MVSACQKRKEFVTEPEKVAEPHQTLKSTNLITFPSSPEPKIEPEPEPQDADQPPTQNYGCGQRARPQKGHYKAMNEGLIAAIAPSVDNISDDEEFEEIVEHHDDLYDLPPNVGFAGHYATDPRTLDEALQGPNAKEWQEALDYEIHQLEKLRTWVVKDLPEGQTAIPCSEITRVK